MTCRHAFHAGNFADVVEHAILARILVYLGRKEAPFRFLLFDEARIVPPWLAALMARSGRGGGTCERLTPPR